MSCLAVLRTMASHSVDGSAWGEDRCSTTGGWQDRKAQCARRSGCGFSGAYDLDPQCAARRDNVLLRAKSPDNLRFQNIAGSRCA